MGTKRLGLVSCGRNLSRSAVPTITHRRGVSSGSRLYASLTLPSSTRLRKSLILARSPLVAPTISPHSTITRPCRLSTLACAVPERSRPEPYSPGMCLGTISRRNVVLPIPPGPTNIGISSCTVPGSYARHTAPSTTARDAHAASSDWPGATLKQRLSRPGSMRLPVGSGRSSRYSTNGSTSRSKSIESGSL